MKRLLSWTVLLCSIYCLIASATLLEAGEGNLSLPAPSPDGTKAVFVRNGKLHLLTITSGQISKLPVDSTGKQSGILYFGGQVTNQPYIWFPDSRRVLVRAGNSGEGKWIICDTKSKEVQRIYKDAPRSRVIHWAEPGPKNPVEYTHYDTAHLSPDAHHILFRKYGAGHPKAIAIYDVKNQKWEFVNSGFKVVRAGWISQKTIFYQEHFGTEAERVTLYNIKDQKQIVSFNSQGTYSISFDHRLILDISWVAGSQIKVYESPEGTRIWERDSKQLKEQLLPAGFWGPESHSFIAGFHRVDYDRLPKPEDQAPELPEDVQYWIRIFSKDKESRFEDAGIIPRAMVANEFQSLWLKPGRWIVYGNNSGSWTKKEERRYGRLPTRKMDLFIWDRKNESTKKILDGPLINFDARKINQRRAVFTASTPDKHVLYMIETGNRDYKLTPIVQRTDQYVPVSIGSVLNGKQLLIGYVSGTRKKQQKVIWCERRSIARPDQTIHLYGNPH